MPLHVQTGDGPDPGIATPARYSVRTLLGFPMVRAGDSLAGLILDNLKTAGDKLTGSDIIAITQKIVSKAEGRTIDLAGVQPGPEALKLAGVTGKDARLVELILSQSER